jgi:long-subunit fatty acid transport protein
MKFSYINHAKSFFILFILFVSPIIHGQTLSQSPYGRFALGDNIESTSAFIQGLGGVTQALADSNALNLSQPAALADLEGGATIFEGGISASSIKYLGLSSTQEGRTAGFGYFGLAFPIKRNRWNVSLSLTPISNAGFTLRDSIADSEARITNLKYTGNGGFTAFTLGNGFHIGKNLNLGIQFRYIFGKTNYSSMVVFNSDSISQRNSLITNSSSIADFDMQAGIQYQIRFRKMKQHTKLKTDSLVNKFNSNRNLSTDSMHLIIGGTFRPLVNLNATSTYLAQTFFGDLPGLNYTDTIVSTENSGSIVMPMQFGGGITLKRSSNKWLVTADYVYTDWSGFKIFGRQDSVRSSYRLGLGIQVNPMASSRNIAGRVPYWKKIRYRAGGYYSDGYLRLNGKAVPEYGFSLGFGLPVVLRTYNTRSSTSLLNFAITIGQRGISGVNNLNEQFVKGTLSFSLNDRWFRKFQYD